MTMLSLTKIFLRGGVGYNIYTLYDCFLGAGANYAIYRVNLVP